MDPSVDLKSLSSGFSGTFGTINQQVVDGMDAGKTEWMPLVKEEQKTQHSVDCRGVSRSQKSFFDKVCSNERYQPCEPSLAGVNQNQTSTQKAHFLSLLVYLAVPVQSSIVCFDNINKEGTSFETKEAISRSSIVVVQNSDQNVN